MFRTLNLVRGLLGLLQSLLYNHLAVNDAPILGRDLAEEILIVRDQHHRTLELPARVDPAEQERTEEIAAKTVEGQGCEVSGKPSDGR